MVWRPFVLWRLAAATAAGAHATTTDASNRMHGGGSEVSTPPTLLPLAGHHQPDVVVRARVAVRSASKTAPATTPTEKLSAPGTQETEADEESAGVATAILLELGHAHAAVAAARARYAAEADPVLPGNMDSFGSALDNFDQAQRVSADRTASAKAAAASRGEQRYCGHALNAWLGSCVY